MAPAPSFWIEKHAQLAKYLIRVLVEEAHGWDSSHLRRLQSEYADIQIDEALRITNRLRDGRKLGQVNGARANKDAADRRRDAIKRQARILWAQEPRLRFNLVATARKIETLKLPELQNGKNAYLGVDAIRKHLMTLRQDI